MITTNKKTEFFIEAAPAQTTPRSFLAEFSEAHPRPHVILLELLVAFGSMTPHDLPHYKSALCGGQNRFGSQPHDPGRQLLCCQFPRPFKFLYNAFALMDPLSS